MKGSRSTRGMREKPPKQMLMVIFTLDGISAEPLLLYEEWKASKLQRAGLEEDQAPSAFERHRDKVASAVKSLLSRMDRPEENINRMRAYEPPVQERFQERMESLSMLKAPNHERDQDHER